MTAASRRGRSDDYLLLEMTIEDVAPANTVTRRRPRALKVFVVSVIVIAAAAAVVVFVHAEEQSHFRPHGWHRVSHAVTDGVPWHISISQDGHVGPLLRVAFAHGSTSGEPASLLHGDAIAGVNLLFLSKRPPHVIVFGIADHRVTRVTATLADGIEHDLSLVAVGRVAYFFGPVESDKAIRTVTGYDVWGGIVQRLRCPSTSADNGSGTPIFAPTDCTRSTSPRWP